MKKKEHAEDDYDAFISYHRVPLNNKVAKKLQDLLESPRLVKNSHYAVQDGHTLRKSKLHIFLDRAELSASSHLTGDIRDALRRSRYLIVVCTEDLKESEWCMEEIRMFLELHSGNTDKILTLLVNGKPKSILPGDARAASDTVNEWILEASVAFLPDDADVMEEYLKMILLEGEILAWRQQIDASVYKDYLEDINADFGMEVTEVSPEAQKEGLRPGDLITEVDKSRVTCNQSYLRLRNLSEACSLTVLRDGENITVPISGQTSFYGYMKVRFEEE